MYPSNFISQEEYNTYCSCLRKINLRDEVSIYVNQDNRPTKIKTNIRYDFSVIGVVKNKHQYNPYGYDVLLGSSTKRIGDFWPLDSNRHVFDLDKSDLYKLFYNIENYKYAYWVDGSIRIASITKYKE